ncbi:hypothetical protein BN6_22930 [Saccharothrix espanaensis DSM 44229]|uniref:HTH cro/C1-type domain-containing protein n=1 Tax=Saccharothrix espanaensis (strain ATCC 51144 / DSM 44229 / JCM 9112 / NBRC 15066 / NRRL 15764) TaxID=1179773 RepID=K0JZD9_SACES|nr:hypothetical protein BN6_22930 [Saccharothrix espanaensis DSM 44229]
MLSWPHGTVRPERTGISRSTLSRLEVGQRRPSLELLLPIVRTHRVPLDELTGGPEVADPSIRPTPRRVDGSVVLPLTRQPAPLHTFKTIIPPDRSTPDLCTHEGHEWLYVVSGRLRLVLGEQDLVPAAGEAAEFETRLPALVRQHRGGPGRGAQHPRAGGRPVAAPGGWARRVRWSGPGTGSVLTAMPVREVSGRSQRVPARPRHTRRRPRCPGCARRLRRTSSVAESGTRRTFRRDNGYTAPPAVGWRRGVRGQQRGEASGT